MTSTTTPKRRRWSYWFAGISLFSVGLMVGLAPAPALADEEWEESTPYYEDDAWYDVSEWLDGNDYNPTDEAVGRWDDEVYDSNVANDDQNSDTNTSSNYGSSDYGYAAGNEDDWYYDYYDDSQWYTSDPYNDGIYLETSDFYDFDGDGTYDAYASYYDWDVDGIYEDFNYYSFGNLDNAESMTKQASQQAQANTKQNAQNKSSKRYMVDGTIEKTKEVKVRSGKNLVALVKTDDGSFAVDLGSAQNASQWDLKKDDTLKAFGPVTSVGDKKVLLAKSIQINENDQKESVDRNGVKVAGSVKSLKTTKVRGTEHQLALVKSNNSDKQVLVDLGPVNKLSQKLSEGDIITAHGVPIRINKKPALLANKLTQNGETTTISRSKQKATDGSSKSSGSQQSSQNS